MSLYDWQTRFHGESRDEETGYYNYGYRYYDPTTGRWPSRDPIGELGGENLQAFVGNDAINRWDKHGLAAPVLVAGGVVAVIMVRWGPYIIWANKKFPNDNGRMQHCWTSCMIARDSGTGIAAALGAMKEGRDLIAAALNDAAKRAGLDIEEDFGDRMLDIADDFQRNGDGYECAGLENTCIPGVGWVTRWFRKSCEECCKEKIGKL
jgi:RHS repeat-associated protein